MNVLLKYIGSFMALFLIFKLLIHMVPRENFQRYIRFFSEMVLVFCLLSPILHFISDEEALLDSVKYNEFMEGLSEAAINAERIAFTQNDLYISQYEDAIALDASSIAKQHGFAVRSAEVTLSEQFEIERISLTLAEEGKEDVIIGKIILDNDGEEGTGTEDEACRMLKEDLQNCYRLSEEKLVIRYE